MPQEFLIGNIKGDKGDVGTSLKILAYYTTFDELSSAVQNPSVGDAYGVGSDYPYDIYIYSGNKGWVNNGALAPDINEQTPNYAEATTLENLTSGEKISLAFGKIKKAITDLMSHLNHSWLHNTSVDGGCSIGKNATSEFGGAIGHKSQTVDGGAAGSSASSVTGAAIGFNTKTGAGVAAGSKAQTIDVNGNAIDAVQLGTGTNTKPKTVQAYDYQLMKADGTIPDERMPSKAPSGHGLGEPAKGFADMPLKDILKQGGGFYQVDNAEDTPYENKDWVGVIQASRSVVDDTLAGVQMVFQDWHINNPQMWLRTVLRGDAGNWVEMLHTGNIEDYRHKIVTGAYTGDSALSRKISLDFTPDIVLVFGKSGMVSFLTQQNGYRGCGGMAFKGFPCKVADTATIEIVDGGFNVAYIAPNGDATANVPMTNESGAQYYYMAIRNPIK